MSTDSANIAIATLAQLSRLDASDPKSHPEIIQKCQSIIDTLQNPQVIITGTLAMANAYPCLVALSDMGVFEKLALGPMTAEQVAQQCNADFWLVVRLMRVATAWGVVLETGPQSYAATVASNGFATPSLAAGLRHGQLSSKNVRYLPRYLKETQYRNITSPDDGLFQYTHKTKLRSFQWMQQKDHLRRNFDIFMTTPRTTEGAWTSHFKAKDRIFDGVEIDPTVPLLVDIGGGMGQDLHLVKKDLLPYAVSKGQLIVQDQPSAINNVPADMYDADFEYMKHDFFTAQPVNGARIYLFKTVLHDWPDEKAVRILRRTAAAMKPGYSKLWIQDGVIPDTGASKVMVWQDITMMAAYGGLERTRGQWAELLTQAGLKIVDVQSLADGVGFVEAVLDV
ncbi:S-adenosyl-L-methionine-dependent methyltransferase [Aspergillus unguis]